MSVDGTASSLRDTVRSTFGRGTVMYAKTGTLGVDPARLYVRSFLFGIGNDFPSTPRALDCGVVGMVYFKLRRRPEAGTSLPDYHLAFFREGVIVPLKQQWKALSGCG